MIGLLERYLTFKPDATDHGGLRGIPHQRIRFGADFGLDLDGVWMPQDSHAVVLFIHGNRYNLTRFSEHYELFRTAGISCFTFDYPGYGLSAGTPSEKALYASARAAHAWLCHVTGRAPECIAVYGCSLGGAVALELVSHAGAGCVITESAFTNSWDMARFLYPYIPAQLLLPCRFDNSSRIQKIKIPKLVIHGERDPRVPVHMARSLFEKAHNPKKLELIPLAEHVDCLAHGGPALRATISSFIARHCS